MSRVIGMTRRLYAVSAIALLLLTGCSAGTPEDSEPETASSATTAPEATDAPLTAKTPAPAVSAADSSPEAAYLEQVREALPEDTAIPDASDQQLLDAAAAACAQMADGVDFSAVAVIDGEQTNDLGVHEDSALIAAVARKTLCV